MIDNGFNLYRHMLASKRCSDLQTDIDDVLSDFEDLKDTPAYQEDAKRNGKSQPIVVYRKGTYKCKFKVAPGDEMFIGDLVEVLNENWLVMDTQVDEYGMVTGDLWMCNMQFNFQNGTPEIFTRYAILDNGSYTDTTGKPVSTPDAHFTCYISLDDATSHFYIDKRLAIDTIYDSNGEEILQVGKISWLDAKSYNYGEGAHLLAFRLDSDLYDKEKDSILHMICDFIEEEETEGDKDPDGDTEEEEKPTTKGGITIEGKDSLRIGSSRTYKAIFSDLEQEPIEDIEDIDIIWGISGLPNLVVEMSKNRYECVVKVPLYEDYIGETITITCGDASEEFTGAAKEVVIVPNG